MGSWDPKMGHFGDPENQHSKEGLLLSYLVGTELALLNLGAYWVCRGRWGSGHGERVRNKGETAFLFSLHTCGQESQWPYG